MLDRVTITGADDSVSPVDLLNLSCDFPFVEWGILVSQKKTNTDCPRFPSSQWIEGLQAITQATELQLSLHVCGRWVRSLLMGVVTFPTDLLQGFQRVQLNFHGDRMAYDGDALSETLVALNRDFIFQLDGVRGNEYLENAEVSRASGLFDVSGGAGILPREWPSPVYLDVQPGPDGEGVEQWGYHGYAGGLSPDNLAEQLPRILKASAGTKHTSEGRIWIDTETRVRSDDDRQFDLAKVRRFLEIAAPYVGRWGVNA